MQRIALVLMVSLLTSCVHHSAPSAGFASAPDMQITECRKRIDAIDAQVMELLNERTVMALEIGRARQRAGIPESSAKGRAEAVLQRASAASRPPLTPEAARRIYERIVAEMVEIQRNDRATSGVL